MKGYKGCFLDINLTERSIEIKPIPKEWYKKYLGGVGFTSRILYEELPMGIDALSSENILAFATGPLTGTNVPTAARVEASAKSPATGLIGTSNSGNYWGSELKFAGYDGIIIRGKASQPVYIYINDDQVGLASAGHLWGLDAWETIDTLRLSLGDEEIQVACIGQAGENLVRYASIENGYYDAWGRTGLGAVMGSKNLKAIAVRGSGGIAMHDRNKFLQASSKIKKAIYASPFYGPFAKFGTMLATVPYAEFEALPGRNFQTGTLANWMETRTRKQVHKYSTRGISCISCPIACAHWVEVPDGKYKGLKLKDMEVTPVLAFCAGCDIDDLSAAAKITEMCQRLGMDMVSAGGCVAFAMELFEKGILAEKEIGFSLAWGDDTATLKLLEMIARRQGIGDILAEGTKRAGEKLQAEEYAMHIKGLEIPMADARGRWSTWTFGNITNIRGGDHLRNRNPVENLRLNENPEPYKTEKFELGEAVFQNLDMPENIKEDIFSSQSRDVNIPRMSKWAEDLISVYNAVGICIRPPVLQSIGPTLIAESFSTLTGIEISAEEVMLAGERIWNMQKLFNIREGENPNDSRFPSRFYKQVLLSSDGKERKLDEELVHNTLKEYFSYRGWDEKGVPSPEKLQELGLS